VGAELPFGDHEPGLYNGGKPLCLSGGSSCVPGQLVVKFSPEKSKTIEFNRWKRPHSYHHTPRAEEILINKYGAEIENIRKDRCSEYYIIETRIGCDMKHLEQRLLQDPLVEYASPNYTAAITAIPDDPFFGYQYALYNTGQVYLPDLGLAGTTGSDIKAVEGWDWTTGSEDVVIAIIDTGVFKIHEDLLRKIVPGYNFVDDNYDTEDTNGHGTFVASIAAAETNNNIGIAGISWKAKIMPVKCVGSDGTASYLAIAAAIRYAADNGAQVINLSLGGEYPSVILEDACRYAFEKGCVIVAAAGNNSGPVLYPAAYDDYCLAVAATDADDNITNWSNFGPQVDVAAPGDYVFAALYLPDNPHNYKAYGWGSGTSFAAPYVSGAAALVMAYKPFLSNSTVMNLIKYTADDVNESTHPGVDYRMGYGRLNLKSLLGPYELN
jgi:subtilisin family serine protease